MSLEIDVHLPDLFPKQMEIVNDPARYKVLACGRRFGKTLLASDVLVNAAIDGLPVAYFSLTGKNASEIWELTKSIVEPITQKKNETERIIRLVTGGTVEFWSLDKPTPSRGRKYAGLIIDEAAFIRKLRSVWSRVLRPFLADYEGWAYFMSSPNGANDFFHQMYLRGQDPAYPKWASWNLPTWANPYIKPQEIAEIKATTAPEDFEQEYGAQFTSASGLVYKDFSVDNITTQAEYNPAQAVWWACDDGYVHGKGRGDTSYHPRTVLLMQQNELGGVNVFDEYLATGETHEQTIINLLAKPYAHPYAAWVDGSAALFRGELSRKGITNANGTHPVSEGIKNVRRFILDAKGVRLLRVHPRCANIIYEMSAYHYDETTRVQAGEPVPAKVDDHSQDALRYGLYHLRMSL